MRLELGPLDSSSVIMWTAYARTVLVQVLRRPRSGAAPVLDERTIETFERYLDQWDAAAAADTEFRWSGELDSRQARTLVTAWLDLVGELERESRRRGFPLTPPEGDAFYTALVQGLVAGFERESEELAGFADHLREDWPGFKGD